MTNDEKKKIAEAARKVAAEVCDGKRLGTGSPFCNDGTPNCAIGHVLALMGYRGKEGHTAYAISTFDEEVDAYNVFHDAIDDSPFQENRQPIARIWRSNDRHDETSLVAALLDYANEVEKHIQ